MSQKFENGYIPTKLDLPPKVLFWSLDSVIIFAVPIWAIGFIMKSFVLAVLVSFALSYAFNKVKTSNHPKFLKHFIYWYLPSFLGGIKLKSLPSSHIRNFLS